MRDITVKIIFGIVPEGQAGDEVEAEVADLGPIIIIVGKTLIKPPNEGEGAIKTGEGVMVTTHSIISNKIMLKITNPHKDNTHIWHSHKGSCKYDAPTTSL